MDKRLNLDECIDKLFPGERPPKHPDYALLLDDHEVVLVEETGRPEIEDVDRLEEFLEMMGDRWSLLFKGVEPETKTLALHFRRRDNKATKYLTYRAREFRKKYGVILIGAACEKPLKERLRIE